MWDVLHQLIDRVRWPVEEEQLRAHQAVEDYRAGVEAPKSTPAPTSSTVDTQATPRPNVSVADGASGNGK
jgi:hypothetical protein